MKKVALITGANRGLGLALTQEALKKGYTVYAGTRNVDTSVELNRSSEDDPHLTVVQLDVTDAGARKQVVEKLHAQVGKLDLLIHNAGINSSSPAFGPPDTQVTFGKLTEEALIGVTKTNAVAPLLFTQELAGLLEASQQGGKVVAISSWFASIEECGERNYNYGYSGSKAQMNAFFRLAANALKPMGVIALMINPGWMKTDMGGQNAKRLPEESAAEIMDLAENATVAQSGGFLDCNGEAHPW